MNIYIKNAGSDIYPLRANTMLPALKYKPDQRVQCEKPHAQFIDVWAWGYMAQRLAKCTLLYINSDKLSTFLKRC